MPFFFSMLAYFVRLQILLTHFFSSDVLFRNILLSLDQDNV